MTCCINVYLGLLLILYYIYVFYYSSSSSSNCLPKRIVGTLVLSFPFLIFTNDSQSFEVYWINHIVIR